MVETIKKELQNGHQLTDFPGRSRLWLNARWLMSSINTTAHSIKPSAQSVSVMKALRENMCRLSSNFQPKEKGWWGVRRPFKKHKWHWLLFLPSYKASSYKHFALDIT